MNFGQTDCNLSESKIFNQPPKAPCRIVQHDFRKGPSRHILLIKPHYSLRFDPQSPNGQGKYRTIHPVVLVTLFQLRQQQNKLFDQIYSSFSLSSSRRLPLPARLRNKARTAPDSSLKIPVIIFRRFKETQKYVINYVEIIT